ncbi:hypothetical protein B7P43_G08657 [Cryptotermes secundus]|uniref:Endonuclease/exonuclease/phosphatase domain-containing protein n=1 Tax=Cryptotermes secundus TaxID=105785 RepID=A0A2J7PUJ6_9NEOP|nr:hypothetical protein B7P43_G08657 [Cryptotermes secundus]
MDMRFGTWNIRSMYRAGSLRAVVEEILKYKLDLAGVQVKWEGGGIAPAGEYTFFYGKVIKNRFYEELEHVFDKFPKYSMKISLGDSNAKVGRENILKPTIWNGSLYEISNDNGLRVVNFATSKNLTVKSTMFPHYNIHKFTWTYPDGKIHNQIDHILIDRRRHSNILDVRSFKAADCVTDYYLVVAKERLADSHILNRWKNYFSPLLNVHRVSDVRQIGS